MPDSQQVAVTAHWAPHRPPAAGAPSQASANHRRRTPPVQSPNRSMGFLPSYPSLVIYASMGSTAAFIFTFAFFGIASTFYRDSSPLQPPTRALGAALTMLAPLAAVLASLVYLAEANHLGVTADVTPGGCWTAVGEQAVGGWGSSLRFQQLRLQQQQCRAGRNPCVHNLG